MLRLIGLPRATLRLAAAVSAPLAAPARALRAMRVKTPGALCSIALACGLAGALAIPTGALGQTSALPSFRLVQRNALVSPTTALGLYNSPASPAQVARGDRVKATAAGLQNDPDRIYQFVRDNFEYEPQFGLHKGADGVLMDRAGGAFDQAALMVGLLRESGVSAQYVLGTVELGGSAASILRVANAKEACILLASGGTPATVNGQTDCNGLSGAIVSLQMLHVWVRAQIGGQAYDFDPSLKSHAAILGQDLWALAGRSATSAWSGASGGLSQGARTVAGYNPAAVETTLNGLGAALVGRLKTDQSAKSLEELTGGWTIIPAAETPLRQTTLPNAVEQATWSGEVPAAYRATLRVQTQGFDALYDTASIYAERVELQMYKKAAQPQPEFRVYVHRCEAAPGADIEDPCVGANTTRGAAIALASWDRKVTLTIHHPYAGVGAYAEEAVLKTMELGPRADLVLRTAGGTGARHFAHRAAVDQNIAANYIPAAPNLDECYHGDDPPLETDPDGETNCPLVPDPEYFKILGVKFSVGEARAAEMKFRKDHLTNVWAAQFDRALSLFEPLSNSRILHQHSLGLALQPQANGYGALDIDTAVAIAPGGADQPRQVLQALAAATVGFESAALASAFADRSEFSAEFDQYAVQANMINAPERMTGGAAITVLNPGETATLLPGAITQVDTRARVDEYLQAGFSVAVSASNGGDSFFARRADGSEAAWILYEAGTNAAFRKGAVQAPNPLEFLGKEEVAAVSKNLAPTTMGSVDLQSGALRFSETPDIVVGSGGFPQSLSFTRSYSSSGAAAQGGGLGAGWSYNWASSVSASSDVLALFPDADSAAGAATLVATMMYLEAGRRDTIEANLVAGATAKWWRSQIHANVRSLSGGGASGRFVRLVDGTWRNSASPSDVLTILSATNEYDWTMSDGSIQQYRRLNEWKADTNTILPSNIKALKAWVFPTKVQINLTYQVDQKGNFASLRKVANNLGWEINLTQIESTPRERCAQPDRQCWQMGTYAGTLSAVSGGGDSAAFGYLPVCEYGSNLCYGLLTDVTHPLRRTRLYVYWADPMAYSVLTAIGDVGVAAPRAQFAWVVEPGLVRPHVTASTDGLGRITRYYTAGGFLGAAKDAMDGVHRVVFDDNGRQVAALDTLGRRTRQAYDGAGRLTRTVAPELNAEAMTYDVRGNVLRTCRIPKGRADLPCDPNAGDISTSTTYVEGPNVAVCSNQATCNKPAFVFDGIGYSTTYSWNGPTGLLSRIQKASVEGGAPIISYTYNNNNPIGVWFLQKINEKNYTFVEDDNGNQVEAETSSPDLTTVFTYASASHYALESMTTGGSNRTWFFYNAIGDVVGVDGPRTDVVDVRSSVWDANRRLVYALEPSAVSAGQSLRSTVHSIYDIDGQLQRTEQGYVPASTALDLNAVTTAFVPLAATAFAYDAVGNRVRADEAPGTPDAMLTHYSYDADDRLVCTAVRMNRPLFASLPAVTDACTPTATSLDFGPDRITRNVYDAAGQVKTIERGVGTSLLQAYATYGYTLNGKQAYVTDASGPNLSVPGAKGNHTTFEYDGFDRLTKQIFPVAELGMDASNPGDFEEYQYDQNDNRSLVHKRDKKYINYSRDANGRVIAKIEDGRAAYYKYDLSGKLKYAKWSDGSSSIYYIYDASGWPISEKETAFKGVNYAVEMYSHYDAAGNRISLYGGLSPTEYVYDAANRLTEVHEYAAPYAKLATFTYDALNRRTSLMRGNGTVVAYGYDGVGRLKTLSDAKPGAASSGTSQSFLYSPAGQIVDLGQGNPAFTWTGQPTTGKNTAANGLNQDAGIAALNGGGYDANGNLIRDGVRTLGYDAENRLVSVSGASNLTITYDPIGRISTVGGLFFFHDGERLRGEYTSSFNRPIREYVHGVGTDEPLAVYDIFGALTWLHQDRQSSVIATSDPAGTYTPYTYGPYGEPQTWAGSRFRYTGQIALPEAQLYHYKARVYDPMMGRFLQTDPIGYSDGLNWYAYVGNDPLNRSDPTGQLADQKDRQLENASKAVDAASNGATVLENAGKAAGPSGQALAESAGALSKRLGPASSALKAAERIANGERPVMTAAQEGGNFVLSEAGAAVGGEAGLIGGTAICGPGCGAAGAAIGATAGAILGPDAVRGTVGLVGAGYNRLVDEVSKTQAAQSVGDWRRGVVDESVANAVEGRKKW